MALQGVLSTLNAFVSCLSNGRAGGGWVLSLMLGDCGQVTSSV